MEEDDGATRENKIVLGEHEKKNSFEVKLFLWIVTLNSE